jgi:hypothetical protein
VPPLDWYHQQATLYNICSLNPLLTQPRPASRPVPRLLHCLYCRGSEGEEEEEEEEEDLFVFNIVCLIMKIFCVHFCIFVFLHLLNSLCTFFAFFAFWCSLVLDLSNIDYIGDNQYGESYNIGNKQYSSKNLSYCPIHRFLESIRSLKIRFKNSASIRRIRPIVAVRQLLFVPTVNRHGTIPEVSVLCVECVAGKLSAL